MATFQSLRLNEDWVRGECDVVGCFEVPTKNLLYICFKEKQADLARTADGLKESVNFVHGRIDLLDSKAYKYDSALTEAKEALEKRYLYLEAYSRRENLKFAGIPGEDGDREATRGVLVDFLSKQLGIEHPEEIEFQRTVFVRLNAGGVYLKLGLARRPGVYSNPAFIRGPVFIY